MANNHDGIGHIALHQPSSSSVITAQQPRTRVEADPDTREWGKRRPPWDRRTPPLMTGAGSCVETAFPIENRDNLGRVLQTPYKKTKRGDGQWRELEESKSQLETEIMAADDSTELQGRETGSTLITSNLLYPEEGRSSTRTQTAPSGQGRAAGFLRTKQRRPCTSLSSSMSDSAWRHTEKRPLYSRGKLVSFSDAPGHRPRLLNQLPLSFSLHDFADSSSSRGAHGTPSRGSLISGLWTPLAPQTPLPSFAELKQPGVLEVWPSPGTAYRGRPHARNTELPDISCISSVNSKPRLLVELEAYAVERLKAIGISQLYATSRASRYEPGRFEIFQNIYHSLMDNFAPFRDLMQRVENEYQLLFDQTLRLSNKHALLQEIKSQNVDMEAARSMLWAEMEQGEEYKEIYTEFRTTEANLQAFLQEEEELRCEMIRLEKKTHHDSINADYVHQQNLEVARRAKSQQKDLEEITGSGHDWQAEREVIMEKMPSFHKIKGDLKEVASGMVLQADQTVVLEEHRDVVLKVNMLNSNDGGAAVMAQKMKANAEQRLEIQQLEDQLPPLTFRPSFHDLELKGEKQNTKENVRQMVEVMRAEFSALQNVQEELPPELMSDSDEEADEAWIELKFFEGRGTGPEVPDCYKWDGEIHNRKLGKGDTERLIKDYWKHKKHYDSSLPAPSDPLHFMYHWLKTHKRKETQESIADWAHNLRDAAIRYKYDADCELWLGIMEGEFDQAVYWDEFEMLSGLSTVFQKLDTSENKKVTGKLPKSKFLSALKKFFPLKTEVRYNRMKRCLAKEDAAEGNKVEYIKLFAEDKNGDQGPFAEMVRDQHKDEREEYITDLGEALRRLSADQETITAEQAMQGLSEIDPKKLEKDRVKYVLRGLGPLAPPSTEKKKKKEPKINESIVISIDEFMVNIGKGVVKTSTNRDQWLADLEVEA